MGVSVTVGVWVAVGVALGIGVNVGEKTAAGFIACVLSIPVSGSSWLSSGGDPEQADARNTRIGKKIPKARDL